MRWIKLSGLIAVVALAASGCGGPASGAAKSPEENREDAMLAFTECMREHGVDVDASEEGGNFRIAIGAPPGGAAEEGPDDETRAAMEACQDKMPKFGEDLTPEERAAMEDAMLEFAACMREHGVDLPDPGAGGFIQKFEEGSGNQKSLGADPESEEFKAAQEACEDKLPDRGVAKEGF